MGQQYSEEFVWASKTLKIFGWASKTLNNWMLGQRVSEGINRFGKSSWIQLGFQDIGEAHLCSKDFGRGQDGRILVGAHGWGPDDFKFPGIPGLHIALK
eukprot:8683377-Heterocapsa_arctica.AAC.1